MIVFVAFVLVFLGTNRGFASGACQFRCCLGREAIEDGGGRGAESWLRQDGMETCCECNQNHTMQSGTD